jgi:hypothetical protein
MKKYEVVYKTRTVDEIGIGSFVKHTTIIEAKSKVEVERQIGKVDNFYSIKTITEIE